MTATATTIPPELRGVVQPWQRLDPAWLAGASVWLVARYTSDSYPCRPGPDGRLDMIQRDAFAPTRVLRGVVAAPGIDLDLGSLRGPAYPAAFSEGRDYLLLLRPSAAMTTRLADPRGAQSMHERLGAEQVVAIVDLSQSADESVAEAVTASRSGEQDGLRFDPALWAAARGAATISADQHEPIARFLAARLLQSPGMALADARAWVGAPDDQVRIGDRTLIYRYWLSRAQYAKPVAGGVYGQLELEFHDRRLARGSISYFRWHFRPQIQSSIELPAEQLRGLGLHSYRLGPERQ
ncbi:MAG: hypothetical protein H0T76_06310 [Nannocystis sp.]|nr:hypothetical protein [Nannocystis sp.]